MSGICNCTERETIQGIAARAERMEGHLLKLVEVSAITQTQTAENRKHIGAMSAQIDALRAKPARVSGADWVAIVTLLAVLVGVAQGLAALAKGG